MRLSEVNGCKGLCTMLTTSTRYVIIMVIENTHRTLTIE